MKKRIVISGDIRLGLLDTLDPEGETILVIAAPAAVGGFDGLSDVMREPSARIGLASAFSFRAAVWAGLQRAVAGVQGQADWRDTLHAWIQALEEGRVKCLHHAQAPLFTRLILEEDRALVFACPVAPELIDTSAELVLEIRGDERDRAAEWAQGKLEQSVDVSSEFLEQLRASWAGPRIGVEDLYYLVLSRYFGAVVGGLDREVDDNPLVEQLTEFQVEAYEYAKGILRRYGGVFLGDVVGLGKTYIAMALLKHLQSRYEEHAVVVAPPSILPAWRDLAAEFRSELQTVSLGKLEDLDAVSDREVLVVDESHHFRNTGTARYERLMDWVRPDGLPSTKKVILLSATPQNNDPKDVKHQLAFFPDNYSRLPFQAESLDEWFQQVRFGTSKMADLLQHVVVRRTRGFIKSNYPNATLKVRGDTGELEDVPLIFPERRSGAEQCLRYSIVSTYENLYQEILRYIGRMKYAPYSLAKYLSVEGAEDPRVQGVRRAGESVRGLYKVLLLKRLESSTYAFRETLVRLLERLRSVQERLKDGRVTLRVRGVMTVDDESGELVEADAEYSVPADLFDQLRLASDLMHDRRAVAELLKLMDGLEVDEKVRRLVSYLQSRDPRSHKTVVFTQFADTAEYLAETLGQSHGQTEVVTGSRGNAIRAARRFSPRSNRLDDLPEGEIDLLISTDALSEGVNLQDADTLINYDIHWNPVRLIQRAGRIDRIGSQHEVIEIASFLPEAALESELGLEAVVRRRIKEFLEVFGEDSGVLPAEDKLDPEAAVAAFTGEALEDEGDELDGISRHVERLLALRRDEPERFSSIVEMAGGREAASSSLLPSVVALNAGGFWGFWRARREDSRLDDLSGLDLLLRHAEAGDRDQVSADEISVLEELVAGSRQRFQELADAVREQRAHPRLEASEEFVLNRLEEYSGKCVASRRDLVKQLIAWVRGGSAQVQLRRRARRWKKENLAAESVFNEAKVLFARFPADGDEVGEVEVVGAVSGFSRPV